MIVACCPWCGAEFSVTDTRCWDCKLSLVDRPDATLAEGTEGDEVGFELEEWSAGERGRLSASLRERGIAFRWEPGLVLVVGVSEEDLVDAILDDMESDDRVDRLRGVDDDFDDDFDDDEEDDDDGGGGDSGERAHAAMGDLFVAADRLIQRPDDGRIAEQLVAATVIVQESRPPYGFEPVAWLQIRELAAAALEAVESDAGDESVSREARTLRDALRPYI